MLLSGVMEKFKKPKGTVHWRPYLLLVGGDSGEGTKSPWLSAAEEDVIPSSYPSSTSFSSGVKKIQSLEKHIFIMTPIVQRLNFPLSSYIADAARAR